MSVTTISAPGIETMNFTPKTGSFLQLDPVTIEDVRGAGEEAVARLRQALAGGAPFRKDRKRKRFYEVEVGRECFYIHVMDDARKVLLLARWNNPDEPALGVA
jgi:hypothetical protein